MAAETAGRRNFEMVQSLLHRFLQLHGHLVGGTAMQKLRIVILGFGTARQKRVLERWTNPKPLQPIWDRAAI